jgi:hypothetical protein
MLSSQTRLRLKAPNAGRQARREAEARQLDRDKARCDMHVSSSPPLSTGLAALTAPGSAPGIVLHGKTMKRRFPFRQVHECPPVYSLRVHWGPWLPASHRRGAFAIRPHPGVHGFPVRRLLCPIRLSPEASHCREAFPPHSFPPALRILRGASRVPHGRLRQNAVGGVFISLPHPLLAAPQALDSGENRLPSVPGALPWGMTLVLTHSARVCFPARLADLLDQGGQGQRETVGLDHASGDAPGRSSATPPPLAGLSPAHGAF